jgi:hypothetical protein
MSFFAKREEPIPEPDSSPLDVVEIEYQAAKRELNDASVAVRVYEATHRVPATCFVRDNKMYIAVNRTQRADPILERLQSAREHARQVFGKKLEERASWRMRAGLVK